MMDCAGNQGGSLNTLEIGHTTSPRTTQVSFRPQWAGADPLVAQKEKNRFIITNRMNLPRKYPNIGVIYAGLPYNRKGALFELGNYC